MTALVDTLAVVKGQVVKGRFLTHLCVIALGKSMNPRKRNRDGLATPCACPGTFFSGELDTEESLHKFDGKQATSSRFKHDIDSNIFTIQTDFTQNSFDGPQPIPQIVETVPITIKRIKTEDNYKQKEATCQQKEAIRLFWDCFYRPASDTDSEEARRDVDCKWTKPWELYESWCKDKDAPMKMKSDFKWISVGHGIRPGNVVRKENIDVMNVPFFNWFRSEERSFMQTNYVQQFWNISYSRIPENLQVDISEMVKFEEAYLRYQKLSSKPVCEEVFHQLSCKLGVPITQEEIYCVIEKFVFQKYQVNLFWKRHYEEAPDEELSKEDAFSQYTALYRYCGVKRNVFHRVSIQQLNIPYSPEKGDGVYRMRKTDAKELSTSYHFRRFIKVVTMTTCPLSSDSNSSMTPNAFFSCGVVPNEKCSPNKDSALKSNEDTLVVEDITEIKTEPDEDVDQAPDGLDGANVDKEEGPVT